MSSPFPGVERGMAAAHSPRQARINSEAPGSVKRRRDLGHHPRTPAGSRSPGGPCAPMTEPASMDDERWNIHGPDVKYLPMLARAGDYALFFRKAAVEITFEGTKYLVVPQAAILVLVRERPTEELE